MREKQERKRIESEEKRVRDRRAMISSITISIRRHLNIHKPVLLAG